MNKTFLSGLLGMIMLFSACGTANEEKPALTETQTGETQGIGMQTGETPAH